MLPVEHIADEFRRVRSSVVISSPTGSGKSTLVPQWCDGRVLVVEPRRVACSSLAQRVAELAGSDLGDAVGYHVRDDRRACADTRILFATPGVVLHSLDEALRFDHVVLDEFHERTLDVDLLLAFMLDAPPRLVVMSATMDADRVAAHIGGVHLHADGTAYPVELRYRPGGAFLPEPKGLVDRVCSAIDEAHDVSGDILVFVPGKSEVAAIAHALHHLPYLDVIELHGGLSLDAQRRAFQPSPKRKVVVATNVAETSLTIPGIGVVVDCGLVRRTRYHQGRGYLTLVPIATDSADQRAGRAGRTGPGVCIRLWSPTAKLAPSTPAEMHRESLVPLLLAAAACGAALPSLRFLDPPKQHAVDAARDELIAIGALDEHARITPCGRELFGLPLDPWLGRLLVEAKRHDALADVVDLVAALELRRPLFSSSSRPLDEADDLRASGCDATALVRAVRVGIPATHCLSAFALAEARATARRLRTAFGLPPTHGDPPIDRKRLLSIALRADPRCAHVARKRKAHVVWANGAAELELARESSVNALEKVDAIVVLATHAVGVDVRKTKVIATCASPVPLPWLLEAGLGRDRVAEAALVEGRVEARIERVFAKRVLSLREEVPVGRAARDAIASLFLDGRLFPASLAATRERLAMRALAARLASASMTGPRLHDTTIEPPPAIDEWVLQRLEALGVESGHDVALLSESDLLAEDVPVDVRRLVEREYPLEVHVGDAHYALDYDLKRRQVLLRLVRGHRRAPPPLSYLPRFEGLRVCVEAGGTIHVLKG